MIADPSLRFWLHAVERDGALCEYADDVARALLPGHLRERLTLPEFVCVTADPDAAEEYPGAILLVPGHPALESMAARVIESGDVGSAHLPWPASALPSAASLLERARTTIDVEHGRIDLEAEPASRYRPLLRLGVRVTYTLEDHFQEREELWADAHAGVALGAAAIRRLRACAPAADAHESSHATQAVSLQRAIHALHRALLARIAERSAALARQSQGSLRSELARSEAYYDAALATIERRRMRADSDRQALLAKQAQAVEAERARRRHEIEAKADVSYAVQPYRAHLVHAPALIVPVVVRRGERRYPFELCWLLAAGEFLPAACPACGVPARLVAGRERLACAGCTA